MSRPSWGEKWARYKRYGLEPLSADATQEEREERLKELRRLRKRRQIKYAIRSGIGTLLMVAAGLALVWWLVSTLAGRDLLLAQIKLRLPANASLDWQKAEGPLRGPMALYGVRFSWTACADADFDVNTSAMALCKDKRTTEFSASRVMLHPKLGALLGRRLQLDALEIDGATLDLAKDDKPFELPSWPDVLPRIEPPLAIEVDRIVVDGLNVSSAGEPSINIRRLEGGMVAESGQLTVRSIDADTDRGRFHVHGQYAPGDGFATDLTATAVFPAAAGQTAGRLGLIARGNLASMDVFIGGRAPAPLRAQLNLRADDMQRAQQGHARWTLQAKSDGLDPAVFSGQRGGVPMAFNLQGDGVGGAANLQGEWSQGAQRIVLQPSKLRLEDQTLYAAPLIADVLDGRITLNGQGTFKEDDADFKFAANARGLRWADGAGEVQVQGDGDFGIAGSREAWAVIGKATLKRDRQQADIHLDGRGDGRGLSLKSLSASMPEGRLDAHGRIDWAPATQWQLDAVLAGFDPGYFVPDFRGAVRGTITSRGSVDDSGQLQADIDVRDLGGQLRGRALGGHGQMQIRGAEYSGELALSLGSSRIDAKGRYGQRVDLDARVHPLQLNDLLPSAHGLLNGQIKLDGPANAINIDADISGNGLRFGDYRANTLSLRGRLPWQGSGGDLRIDARGLQAGIALDSLQANATGAVENLRLQAQANGEIGRMQLDGSALRRGQHWGGTLASFDFQPVRGASWRLQTPINYAQTGSQWSLSQGCFGSSAGGSLCAGGQWPGRGIAVEGRALPLLLATPYLPAREGGEPWVLDGVLDLDAELRPSGNAWAGSAQVRSAAGGLKLGNGGSDGLASYRNLQLDARFDPQKLQATLDTGISGNGTLKARIETGWDEFAPLTGQLDIDMRELGWLEVFVPDLVDPSGTLNGQITLAGRRGSPQIGGDARLANLRAEVPAYGLVLREGNVLMRNRADGVAELTGSVRSGDGLLNINGTIGWQGDDMPVLLNIKGSNVLLSDTRELRATVNPDVVVKIQGGQPLDVSGTVTIPSAQMDLERLDDGVSRSSDVVVLDPANPARSANTGMNLDLALAIGDDVHMRGFGLDGQLGGSLRVRARPGSEMLPAAL